MIVTSRIAPRTLDRPQNRAAGVKYQRAFIPENACAFKVGRR
jgi:hypothetical protein